MKRSLFAGAILLALGLLAALWMHLRAEQREVALEATRSAERTQSPAPSTAMPNPGESARTPEEPAPAPAVEPTTRPPDGRGIDLTVTDEDGRPIEGVNVQHHAPAGVRAYATDARGQCRIALGEQDVSIPYQVTAAGYLHARGYWTYTPERRLELRRLIALSGRVLDQETRLGVPSARVTYDPGCCLACPPIAVDADSSGAYRIEQLPCGPVFLRIEAEGYTTIQRSYELDAAVDAAELEFTLARGTTVRGRVVDFTTGLGLPGATVTTGAQKVVADASGAFEAQVLAPAQGWITLSIEAENRCHLQAGVSAEELARGEALEFKLPESPIVEGIVRDQDGEPVAGVNVNVRQDLLAAARGRKAPIAEPASPLSGVPSSWTYRHGTASASKTDSSGAFRSTGLVPWLAHGELVTFPEGFELERIRIERLPGPGEHLRLDVRLQRPYQRVTGDTSGRIHLNGLSVSGAVSWRAGDRSGEAVVHGMGYTISGLPPGPVELRARFEGCPGPLEGDAATVEIVAGKSVEHHFDLRAASTQVRGHVRFGGGAPAAGAAVSFAVASGDSPHVDWMQERRDVRADEHGAFSLEVPACELELRVTARLGAATVLRQGIRPGADDVELVIAASGKLRYRVVDANSGERIGARSLQLYALSPEGEFLAELRVDAAGPDGWSSHELREGPVELMASGGSLGYRSRRAGAIVVANAETRVELQLEPGLLTRFRLDPPPDERWTQHTIYVVEPESWAAIRNFKDERGNHFDTGPAFPFRSLYERRLQFDDQGVARLECLGPGKYRFRILPDDIALDPESIELTADTAEPIVVRWKK